MRISDILLYRWRNVFIGLEQEFLILFGSLNVIKCGEEVVPCHTTLCFSFDLVFIYKGGFIVWFIHSIEKVL